MLTATDKKTSLIERFQQIRAKMVELCAPLEIEDYVVQGCAEVSPPKWHLAHTTWFWERFILQNNLPHYQPYHPQYESLFNSYYNTYGEQFIKGKRGNLSRPTVKEALAYRQAITEQVSQYLEQAPQDKWEELELLCEIGLVHEEQHQELLMADIKYNFYCNPLQPAYRTDLPQAQHSNTPPLAWHEYDEGIVTIGHTGDDFAIDIEMPAHRQFVEPYALANRLVTCGEYLAFIEDGGYCDSRFWLADGWKWINEHNIGSPLYWDQQEDGSWQIFTLGGPRPLNPAEPVVHLSYFEAHAFALYRGARLPTEVEWENAAAPLAAGYSSLPGNHLESDYLHPTPAQPSDELQQLFGNVWEWTQSVYRPYPGYKGKYEGVGEYNGKFMMNQLVMRGGCAVTPRDHLRPTYRNFYYPHNQWQFGGMRLAKTL